MAKLELSINRIVKNLVTNDVFLATSLRRGYLNLSSVARDLKPSIEKKLGSTANIEAIISALKRNREGSSKFDMHVMESLAETSIQLVSPVAKIVVPANRNEKIFKELVENYEHSHLYISSGTEFTTLIVEERHAYSLPYVFVDRPTALNHNLALIVLKSPASILHVPGFLMSIYSKLAFAGINIIETTNSYTDAIILVNQEDSGSAYSAIQELIEFAKAETKWE